MLTNLVLAGPVYFDRGRMILLAARCSKMWADQPAVLAITKMGVKNSVWMPHWW